MNGKLMNGKLMDGTPFNLICKKHGKATRDSVAMHHKEKGNFFFCVSCITEMYLKHCEPLERVEVEKPDKEKDI